MLEQRAVTSLLSLYSLRTMQPFPNAPTGNANSQIFIGKWGPRGPALLEQVSLNQERQVRCRAERSSAAGSHAWAAFWLIKVFPIIHSHHLPALFYCVFLIIKVIFFIYGYSLVSREGTEMSS